jgi:mycothiol synthase
MASPAPIETRWPAGHDRPTSPQAHAQEAVDAVRAAGGGRLVLWVERVTGHADDEEAALHAAALAAGFTPWRDLLNMRCVLPVPEEISAPARSLPVRAFTDADADAFLEVNNRAFAWHPEQGNMTVEGLDARRAEPWFDPNGFLLHERDGRLAGFCWTKVHPADDRLGDPPMGEIYAIAVDPDFHGQGIGGPLTLAGLDWLAQQGLSVGMLYVESDNHAAVRTYERIGFTVHHIDRAYTLDVAPPPS